MHVAMTYPVDMARRGADWAAASRRAGAEVTELVLTDELNMPGIPAIPWLAQPASQRYVVEVPVKRKPRKRNKRLEDRISEALRIAANHYGKIDVLHTHVADHAIFAGAVTSRLGIPHVHSESVPRDVESSAVAAVFESADAIRTWAGNPSDATLPDAVRDRLHRIATPIDFSIEGAPPQFTAVDAASPVTTPGQPWLAAISPRRILWRGRFDSSAALAMVGVFADLRFVGTQLEMIGDAADTSAIENLIDSLDLDGRIVLRDTGTPRDVAHSISQCDLLLISERNPLLEREAMTALVLGTPVIVPETDVYRELMTSDLGAVVPTGDSEAMIAAIRQVTMVAHHDPVAMSALAGRHTLATVGGQMLDLYHHLVHGEARPATEPTLVDDDRQIAS